METVISTIYRVKNEQGEYVAVLPINSIEDVYYDLDKSIKLKDVLAGMIKYVEVDTPEDMYRLTPEEAPHGATIKVIATGKLYRVADIDNMNNLSGYDDITTNIGVDLHTKSKVSLITYTSNDI